MSTGVTRGAAGAIVGDANTASTFDGTTTGRMASGTIQDAPKVFTAEAWFKTSTTRGGKIIGFGNQTTTSSGSYDRHVYMANNGRLVFGVYPGSVQAITSTAAYNDNQWHHVVASLGPSGMALYVDGVSVGSRSDITTGQSYMGYWRVGGDSVGGRGRARRPARTSPAPSTTSRSTPGCCPDRRCRTTSPAAKAR